MTSLKLGIVGLESAEISRVRILLRLLAGSPNFHWSYAAVGPFDAVLIAQSIATPVDAVRIDVLPAGAAAVGGSLLLPIDANALEEVLYILQRQLQPTEFGELFESPLSVSTSIEEHSLVIARVAPTSAQNHFSIDDSAKYKLKRWPPQAVLRDRKDRVRIANLISRNSFSVEQIVQSSGISKAEVRSFITVLQSFGILNVNETTVEQSTLRLSTHTSAAPRQGMAKRSLLSAIRRTLGI